MAGVILENVSRVYPGQVAAVDGVSLEVLDREFLVLVGPSGCGKSTTLRLIAGLEELSGGKISIASRVVNDVPPKERDIAMVFQNYALYPHMTVYRNLAFGLELREKVNGWGRLWRWALPAQRKTELAARRFSIAQRVHEVARVLGIEDLLERVPRQLSGGERQRVALGRAIVRNPAVFLFDEPLSNLDAKLRVEMRRELKQLHQRLGTTMIYVTHDQVEALTLGERIAVMNDGKLQQVGPPLEVYQRPANRFVAGFIGTPPMNFIDGEVAGAAASRTFRRGAWSVSLADGQLDGGQLDGGQLDGGDLDERGPGSRPATLGVRPEHVRVSQSSAGGWTGQVELVEMLGDSTVATVKLDESPGHANRSSSEPVYVLTKGAPRDDLRPGVRVAVEIDPRQAHLFDPQSGENWLRRTAAEKN